jgi:hypothetical protein
MEQMVQLTEQMVQLTNEFNWNQRTTNGTNGSTGSNETTNGSTNGTNGSTGSNETTNGTNGSTNVATNGSMVQLTEQLMEQIVQLKPMRQLELTDQLTDHLKPKEQTKMEQLEITVRMQITYQLLIKKIQQHQIIVHQQKL